LLFARLQIERRFNAMKRGRERADALEKVRMGDVGVLRLPPGQVPGAGLF
jgi:hypothetical protein